MELTLGTAQLAARYGVMGTGGTSEAGVVAAMRETFGAAGNSADFRT